MNSLKGARMPSRKPQINFQVEASLKFLYLEAKRSGLSVTRLCAAGLLLMLEDPAARARAVARLIAWEEQYAVASADDVRSFFRNLQRVFEGAAPGTAPAPRARQGGAAARRSKS